MKFISSKEEILENANTLENALNSANAKIVEYAKSLVKRGNSFFVTKRKDGLHFYPSRFIGYRKMTIQKHQNYKSRNELDGTLTNPEIANQYGPQIYDSDINEKYRKYCKKLGIVPDNKKWRYWLDDNVSLEKFNTKGKTLEDFVTKKSGSPIQELEKALKMIKNYPRPFRKKIIQATIRNDSYLIRALKKKYYYKCQFPNCKAVIKKANGEFYVEVAHIDAVSKGGSSEPFNLLVLCPNHHKEFDYGKREKIF